MRIKKVEVVAVGAIGILIFNYITNNSIAFFPYFQTVSPRSRWKGQSLRELQHFSST